MIRILIRTLLLLSFIFANEGLSFDNGAISDWSLQGVPERRLRAAKRDHELAARDLKGCLSHEHHLHYVDDDTIESQFAAKVGMKLKTPALLLEDIEHHMEQISCFPSKIYLYFSSEGALQHARQEFKSVRNFLVITSHEGCNEDGERVPHLVSGAAVHLHDRLIILTVSAVPWKNAFDTMTLDFGESDDDFTPRRHGDLRPRQAAAPSQSAVTSGAAASSSLPYPAAPTTTPAGINATATFSPSITNTPILPPDTSLSVSGPAIPAGFKITCKNCTIYGSIDLVAGSFTMSNINADSNLTGGGMINYNSSTLNDTERVIDYLEHGYVEFRSNNFGAHIELESSISGSDTLKTYTAPLPVIPITPFEIIGLASVGPQLNPQLSVAFELSAELDFFYGFEATIPADSYVYLDVHNLTNSTQQGFDNTNVTALPFQAGIPDVSLTVQGGFVPELLLGISFLGGKGSAGAGVFLNTPVITTTFSTVSHVDNKCENVTNSATANKILNGIFDTLTHINSSVEVALGVVAEAEVDIRDYSFEENDPITIVSKSFPLPTECISFDSNAKTYGPPAGTSGSSGSSKPTQSSAANLLRPLPHQNDGWGCLLVFTALLLVVSACLMLF